MGLKNITIPEKVVKIGEGEVSVRGISLSDLMVIVNNYGAQASMAFAKVQQGGSFEEKDVRALIATLASEFPDMISATIALAADSYDEETVKTLKRIPFARQVELIEAVFELTFPNEGEIKKLMESLTMVMTEVSGALTTVRTLPSSIGTGASDAA